MDALDLLFRRLVLAARAAGALERQVTVGEVLDTFVPYAAARRDGQLDSHDDYLHGLMRLVSGERSLLFGDDLMQDDLKAELASPNPDVTVVRTYAQTKLRLSTEGIANVLAGDTTIDLRPPTPLKPGARASTGATAATVSAARPEVPRPATPAATEPPAAAAGEGPADTADLGCPYCAQPLPTGRTVKYCPSCGLNLLMKRCAGCSAEIEPGWKFCVTCGRQA